MKRIVIALAMAYLATACTTTDSATGETRNNNTATGAIIGAVAGGLLGKATGSHHSDRAVVGAAVGALAGAAVGNYMDKQEEQLRAQTEGTGIEVQRDGDKLQLNIPSTLTFDVDKSEIKPEMMPILDQVAATVKQYDTTQVVVKGHTDSTGSESYNLKLSERRAEAVRLHLLSRGVLLERVSTEAYGETRPVASNETAEGRARNRRVEIELIPIVAQ